jgi:pimeloyl-ACP methyl ester carboxylesterase
MTGGSGDVVVLLHGWPQTWFEWRDVMPYLR